MSMQSGKEFIPDKKKGSQNRGRESGKCHISSSLVWVPHIASGEKSGIKVEKRDQGSEYYKVSSMAMLKVGLTI